jgi:hypothetical protein
MLRTVFKPHNALCIISLVREAIESEIDPSQEDGITPAESRVFQHAAIVIPWFWRASQHGIQSDFAQSMVIFSITSLIEDIIMATLSIARCQRL